jgi:hypothetical protein
VCGDEAAAMMTEQDWQLLGWQRQLKEQLPERPKQTGFRVYAILTYTPSAAFDAAQLADAQTRFGAPVSAAHPYDQHLYVDGTDKQLAYVTGTNTEVRHDESVADAIRLLRPFCSAALVSDAQLLTRPCLFPSLFACAALLHRQQHLRRAVRDPADAHEALQKHREAVHHGRL